MHGRLWHLNLDKRILIIKCVCTISQIICSVQIFLAKNVQNCGVFVSHCLCHVSQRTSLMTKSISITAVNFTKLTLISKKIIYNLKKSIKLSMSLPYFCTSNNFRCCACKQINRNCLLGTFADSIRYLVHCIEHNIYTCSMNVLKVDAKAKQNKYNVNCSTTFLLTSDKAAK